jgi:hypothetical protein
MVWRRLKTAFASDAGGRNIGALSLAASAPRAATIELFSPAGQFVPDSDRSGAAPRTHLRQPFRQDAAETDNCIGE